MLSTYVSVLFAVMLAEMGDKTQLLVLGMASRYRLRDIISGVAAAALILSAAATLLGSALSAFIREEIISLLAGIVFLAFAAMTLRTSAEDSEHKPRFRLPAAIGISFVFFIAEIGDKTQLATVAFAADNSGEIISVFAGAATGLCLGNFVGLALGYVFSKKLPKIMPKALAFILFTVFGFKSLTEAFEAILPGYFNAALLVSAILFTLPVLLFLNAKLRIKGRPKT